MSKVTLMQCQTFKGKSYDNFRLISVHHCATFQNQIFSTRSLAKLQTFFNESLLAGLIIQLGMLIACVFFDISDDS